MSMKVIMFKGARYCVAQFLQKKLAFGIHIKNITIRHRKKKNIHIKNIQV